jgi:uncharacterized protein DUF6152
MFFGVSGTKSKEVKTVSSKHWRVVVFFGGLLLAALPAVAHHSVAAEYDFEKPIEFTGTLKQMEWINPHAMLHLEVTNSDGSKTVWLFQTTGAAALRQRGLARASQGGLTVGQTYAISGYAAKNGKSQGFIKTLKMPDGKVITMWFGDPNG